MFNDYFSTRSNQPKSAREIALYVHELEHQRSIEMTQPYEERSASNAGSLQSLRRNLHLLLAGLF